MSMIFTRALCVEGVPSVGGQHGGRHEELHEGRLQGRHRDMERAATRGEGRGTLRVFGKFNIKALSGVFCLQND